MTTAQDRTRIVICGAAGRDFHNFNVVYRDDPSAEVVAFTAAQIPGISGRRYPGALAGPLYAGGIPIEDEADLEALIRREHVRRVIFAYSDLSHPQVMHLASRALSAGADFAFLGPARTMLSSRLPVIAVSAVRTGCGKSQVARWLSATLRRKGVDVAVVRHPMPYGDLKKQAVQRFASVADMDAAECTLEEREEYEPHVAVGNIVFAGVDYAEVLKAAEAEARLVLWDGGNNDFPFFRPDLHIVLVDALRPGQVATHHPGEAVLRMADVILINKVDAASAEQVAEAERAVVEIQPNAKIVRAASPVTLEDASRARGRSVLVVEDGPTITHGGMPHGAGYVAAQALDSVTIVDPRDSAARQIAKIYEAYPHIGPVLPAVGYGSEQLDALRETIERSKAEVVIAATPIDLARAAGIEKPVLRARYGYADAGEPTLGSVLGEFLARIGLR